MGEQEQYCLNKLEFALWLPCSFCHTLLENAPCGAGFLWSDIIIWSHPRCNYFHLHFVEHIARTFSKEYLMHVERFKTVESPENPIKRQMIYLYACLWPQRRYFIFTLGKKVSFKQWDSDKSKYPMSWNNKQHVQFQLLFLE